MSNPFIRAGKGVIYVFRMTGKGIKLAWKRHHFLIPLHMWPKYAKSFQVRIVHKFKHGMDLPFYNPFVKAEYNKWLAENQVEEKVKKFEYNPLISVIIPTYNIERKLLKECLDSILAQTYVNFEICIADDHSTNQNTLKTLHEYEKKDNRIKVVYRKQNGHISKATNSAIKIATGEFIALVDNDDLLPKNALYEVVEVLNRDKNLDLIYTDEDKIDKDSDFCEPHFKPDFSPDTLLSMNYICHLSVLRKSIVDKIGGLRDEYVGAQDYDLMLRFTEKTNKIHHIPKILYHWRKIPGSTADKIDSKNYAIENGKKAIESALKRRKISGKVVTPIEAAMYSIEYKIIDNPLVSIIIPTKNSTKILKKCVDSIYQKTTYKNYEVIVIDNQSDDKSTLALLSNYEKQHKNFRVIKANFPFNYSKINNLAVKKSKGDYIVLLNNDTEIITEKWLDWMLGYAQQKHVGAVGAKLLYPDTTIQHGGVILGLGGVAGHAYVGEPRESLGHYGRLVVPYNYGAVTAACLMIKKSKFNKLSGLDEKLRVAFNDVDFNIKALEEGWYNVFLPQVELMHYESKTRGADNTSEKYKLFLKECDYMKNKWGDKTMYDRFYNRNYSLERGFMLNVQKKIKNV